MDSEKKTILIVEDEVNLSNFLKLELENAGFDVISAYDGLEGLRMAREDRPDVIILDLMLPTVDGLHVCRLIKFDARYASIPVILLTGRNQEQDKDAGKDVGADAYLIKPFDGPNLIEHIRKLIK